MSLFFPYGTVRLVKLIRAGNFGFVEFTDPTVVDYILREKVPEIFLIILDKKTGNSQLFCRFFLNNLLISKCCHLSVNFPDRFVLHARPQAADQRLRKKGQRESDWQCVVFETHENKFAPNTRSVRQFPA